MKNVANLLKNDKDFQSILLCNAILSNDIEVVHCLIALGADINTTYHKDATPLLLSIAFDYPEATSVLLSHGADINQANQDGLTPLMLSSFLGFGDVSEDLIFKNANINQTTKSGESALLFASTGKKEEIVELLSTFGADMISGDEKTILNHINTLYQSIDDIYNFSFQHKNILEPVYATILKQVALNEDDFENLSQKQKMQKVNAYFTSHKREQNTFFYNAVLANLTDVVTYFCTHGANVNTKGDMGITPLMIALHYGNDDMVKTLLDNGANVNQSTDIGITPFMLSVIYNDINMAETLRQKGADINTVTLDGVSAFNIAPMIENAQMHNYLAHQKRTVVPYTINKNAPHQLTDDDALLVNEQFDAFSNQIKHTKLIYDKRFIQFKTVYDIIEKNTKTQNILTHSREKE